jgi:translation initiation factor 3 subunit E
MDLIQYDLSPKIGAHVDSHLFLSILRFIEDQGLYEEKEILRGQLAVLKRSNMTDAAKDIARHLGEEDLESFDKLASEIRPKYEEHKKFVEHLGSDVLTQEVCKRLEVAQKLQLEDLKRKYEISEELVGKLYSYAKFLYECGQYSASGMLLHHYRQFHPDEISKSIISSAWGSLASDIALESWSNAAQMLAHLQQIVGLDKGMSAQEVLNQRVWLAHWALFVFFRNPDMAETYTEFLVQNSRLLEAMTEATPYLLRYFVAGALLMRYRRKKDVVAVLEANTGRYDDPITKFFRALKLDFDFEEAGKQLRVCRSILENDYFLSMWSVKLMENARLLFFETYAKMHEKLCLPVLSEILFLEDAQPSDPLKWVFNAIKVCQIDAKIDAEEGTISITPSTVNPYQRIMERTKAFVGRTQSFTRSAPGPRHQRGGKQ